MLNTISTIVASSNRHDPAAIELHAQAILFRIIMVIGMVIPLLFVIVRAVQGEWLIAIVDLTIVAMLGVILLWHMISQKLFAPRFIAMIVVLAFFSYLTLSTGFNETGLFWSYTLPPLMLFQMNRKLGNALISIYCTIVVAGFLLPLTPAHHLYDNDKKAVYLVSFAVVWLFASYFDFLKSVMQKETAKKTVALEKALNELRDTRDQLFQAQKMEAIGRLAGGIAHDFNNILGIISGYADLIQKNYGLREQKLGNYACSISASAKRGADLTSKLLAYSRKGKIRMEQIDFYQVIDDVIEICRHTINKNIAVKKEFTTTTAFVMGERNQLQNALTNLVINAQDAMPDGGELTFQTTREKVLEGSPVQKKHAVAPGTYIRLTLRDTGCGMDPATLGQAFDPFFTTKEKGKGTGLGLSSVYGTVKSHNGYIELESVPGKGTCVTIILPLTAAGTHRDDVAADLIFHGKGTILLADDEEGIRAMVTDMVQELGYAITTCSDGIEALDYYRAHSKEIDLVILDMIMPRMGGYDCFRELKKINPQVRVLAVSGYVINDEFRNMQDQGALGFVAKPFTIPMLSEALQKALSFGRPGKEIGDS
ncbi:MAG: response regulator [Chitinispirillaceae bacterium]|nr:response regulator [Chitinispirillaceae bacterium]